MPREWTEVESNGVHRHVHLSDDGVFTERLVQDCEPVLEINKAMTLHNDGYTPGREMRRAASIPMGVVLKWREEGIDIFNPNHAYAIKRKLNDPEWRYLRTADGKL